ncbi:MAG TPA: hypothetical protein VKR56_10255 [Candidatus Cybelea sp.]|nr:hypothetical protein [Candidatus Cybelea sp.]
MRIATSFFQKTLSWAVLPAVLSLSVPGVAGAQQPPPGYGTEPVPSYGTPVRPQEQIKGTVTGFDGAYIVYMRDDRGYDDHVSMHQGTEINPLGTRLVEGMPVTIYGYGNGPTFEAYRIDVAVAYTPYYNGAYYAGGSPYYGAGYGAGYYGGAYPWGVGIGIGLGLGFGWGWGCCGYWGGWGWGYRPWGWGYRGPWGYYRGPYGYYRGGYYGGYRGGYYGGYRGGYYGGYRGGYRGGYYGGNRGTVHGSGGTVHASGGGHGGGRPR